MATIPSIYARTITRLLESAVLEERERCAQIADSMNSTQNIGNRIRFGLGKSK